MSYEDVARIDAETYDKKIRAALMECLDAVKTAERALEEARNGRNDRYFAEMGYEYQIGVDTDIEIAEMERIEALEALHDTLLEWAGPMGLEEEGEDDGDED